MRVSLIHQGALGDTVLLIPLARSLRKRFGRDVRITLVTRPALGQMLTMMGFVDGHASADDRDHTMWFGAPLPAPEGGGATSLRANSRPAWAECEWMLSAVSNGADAWASNARLATKAELLFFEPRPPADFAGHVTRWHRQQLRELGLAEAELPLLQSNPDGAIVIHPGSGGEAKCWSREKFLELGRALKRNGILPTFILGEAEQERWGEKFIDNLKGEFPWYLHMGLYELAEKMARARLYLGNDSGVTHLAAATGVP